MRQFLILAVVCLCAAAQTVVNGNRQFLGQLDATGTTWTKPFRTTNADQSGACTNASEFVLNTANGKLFACISGNWQQSNTAGAGTGTVTNVQLSMPNIFTVSGGPVSTSGTFFVSLVPQNPHLVMMGPVSGGAATPTYRALDPTDIPALNYENPLTFALPFTRNVNAIGCPSCVVTSGTYSDPGWLTGISYSKILNPPPLNYSQVAVGGANQNGRQRINFIQGSNVTLSVADNPGANSTDLTISATGGGGGGYATVASSGTNLPQRSTVNFSNEFGAVDNSGAGRTDISLSSVAGSKVAGDITGNAASINTTLDITHGGTGGIARNSAFDNLSPNTTLGDISYRGPTGNTRLAGNTTTTPQFLRQTGTGSASNAPVWATLGASDIPDLSATYQPKLAYTAENQSNKSTDTALGGGSPSNTAYPSQAAVKSYVDAHSGGSPDYEANITGTSISIPQSTHLKGLYPVMRVFGSSGALLTVEYAVNGSGDISVSGLSADTYHVKVSAGSGFSGTPYENDYTSVTSISIPQTTHLKGLFPTIALYTGGAYVPSVQYALNGSGDITISSLTSGNYHIKVF